MCYHVLKDEADFLIDYALKITEEDLRLKRSSTGANGYTVNEIRTSENGKAAAIFIVVVCYTSDDINYSPAFDSNSHIAISLRKRGFSLLGQPAFDEELADGIETFM